MPACAEPDLQWRRRRRPEIGIHRENTSFTRRVHKFLRDMVAGGYGEDDSCPATLAVGRRASPFAGFAAEQQVHEVRNLASGAQHQRMRAIACVPTIIEPTVTGYPDSAPFAFDRVKAPEVPAYSLFRRFHARMIITAPCQRLSGRPGDGAEPAGGTRGLPPQPFGGVQRRIGWRAARASSTRFSGSTCGAFLTVAGSRSASS